MGGIRSSPTTPTSPFTEFLSPGARATFTQWDGKSAALQDATEVALRAALKGDAGAYFAALETLQPGVGEDGKMVLTIYLCKAVLHIQVLKHGNAAADASSDPLEGITEDYRQRALTPHSISINWGPKFAERFTVDEAAALHRRFAILDDKLQAESEHFAPGFQARPIALLFQPDAGRFHARRLHRQLELSLTVHPSATTSLGLPTRRADCSPAAQVRRAG